MDGRVKLVEGQTSKQQHPSLIGNLRWTLIVENSLIMIIANDWVGAAIVLTVLGLIGVIGMVLVLQTLKCKIKQSAIQAK